MANIHDAAIIWIDGHGDLTLSDDDVSIDTSLTNKVIISLFTDRAVDAYELEAGQNNSGWWGDSFTDSPWGSRLWLLRRQKSTQAVADRAKMYAEEALQWLVDEKEITAIEVIATRQSLRNDAVLDQLVLDIFMQLPDGQKAQRTLKMEMSNAV